MYRLTGTNPVAELRVRRVVTARVLVAYALMNDGYSEHEIGCVLGWDHSTINHYRKKMKTFMEAPGYDAERELWEEFMKAI